MRFLYIELEKARRTKSFLFTALLMTVAVFWNLVTRMQYLNKPQLHHVGTLFNSQSVDSLLLPLAVCLFVSRIVGNEKQGDTFKLQQSNGITILLIFYSKLILTVLFFTLLSACEIAIIAGYGYALGLSIPVSVLLIQWCAQIMGSFMLALIYVTSAMLINKSGIIIASGFVGGFLGIVLSSWSLHLWGIINIWALSAYLAPYKYHISGSEQESLRMNFVVDSQLGIRFVIALALCVCVYIVSHRLIAQKEGTAIMTAYIRAEWRKLRKIQILGISAGFLAISSFIGLGLYWANLSSIEDGTQPLVMWGQLTFYYSQLLCAPLMAIITALSVMPEFERKTVDMLKSNNVSIPRLLFAKILTTTVMIIPVQVCLWIIYMCASHVAGISEYSYALQFLQWTVVSVLAAIPVLSVQIFLSVKTRSFSYSVGLSALGGILGFVFIFVNEKLCNFYVYSLPMIALRSRALHSMSMTELMLMCAVSATYTVLFYMLSIMQLRKD